MSKVRRSKSHVLRLVAACVVVAVFAAAGIARACPFCPALKPTLCQQREAADVVHLTEMQLLEDGSLQLKVHRWLKESDKVSTDRIIPGPPSVEAEPGTLLVFFGTLLDDPSAESDRADTAKIDWHAVEVDETSYGYFAQAPSFREPAPERLRYFARFLEHPNATIAADAMMEFAHAPFTDVARAADALPSASIRAWLVDEQVPQDRKGFYGVALGLARDPDDVAANRELLHREIEKPGDDLRAGFDGLLAGLLLLEGERGLELIETRFLAPADSRDGDVRHALAALRFYAEYGRHIALARLAAAVRHLLARPEFAAAAIVELSRWQDWDALDEVVKLYDAPGYPQPATRRAVVGYLSACTTAEGEAVLARLRELHPDEVAEAERHLLLFGAGR